MTASIRIAISAGELSGDEHGAALVRALRKRAPEIQVRGMGGRNLRGAQVETVVDSEKSGAVMGFSDVARSILKIYSALREMKKLLAHWQPQLLIVVDYPDFNLRLAAYAKLLGIRVLYFIPPKVWAWRAGRVEMIKKSVDCAAVIFPHECSFFRDHGFDRAFYVGHPFADTLDSSSAAGRAVRERVRQKYGIDEDRAVVALLPGSRKGELERHLSVMLDGFRLLKKKIPDLSGILPVAATLRSEFIAREIRPEDEIVLCEGQSLDVLRACDAGLLKSGTSNLQAAFIGLPFVMFFITPPIAAIFLRRVLSIKEFSPVNVVRPGTVTELLQEGATPELIAEELGSILLDGEHREALKQNLSLAVKRLSDFQDSPEFATCTTCYERVGALALKLLK